MTTESEYLLNALMTGGGSSAGTSDSGYLSTIFGPGGILERMADAQNPMLKGSGLPLWLKAIMTAKAGVYKGGKAFGMDFTGMGESAKIAQSQEILDRYFNQLVGAPAGNQGVPVLKNEATTTTPISKVRPSRLSQSGYPMVSDLLEQLISRDLGSWRT